MSENIIKDFGDGLILRQATVEDTEALVEFNGRIHADEGSDDPQEGVAAWVRDLMTLPHPTFDPADFTIVEDTTTGKIVSSLNLIDQTWSYDGVEFGVGRPELVGTDPEYRRRGLIREQFDVIHQWSAERGHKLQAITGIPHYYRLFGYEMTINLGGGRLGYLPHVPKLKDDEEDPYSLRPATYADIPFIMDVYARALERNLVGCLRDEAYWQYEIDGKSKQNIQRSELRLIESAEGERVGFIQHAPLLWNPIINMWSYELKAGISWLDVTPSVIRYLVKAGEEYAIKKDDIELAGYHFNMGADHPAHRVLPERMPRLAKPYAWYIRVADVPDFLQHIGPVLERRLAESLLVGHNGDLKISFYHSAVKLSFEKGQLKAVEGYQPEHNEDGDAFFPDLTFLRVLFGYETFEDVTNMFADCFARNDHGRALMPVLFPQKHSNIWAIA
jgi:GNAT superfamily N-acetyltransferase